MFNHAGDGVVMTHHQEHTIRIMDYPSLTVRESPAAHVGGCVAVALDPRGRCVIIVHRVLVTLKNWTLRYLASGGYDSIVNMFDLSEWICARTITSCEYV